MNLSEKITQAQEARAEVAHAAMLVSRIVGRSECPELYAALDMVDDLLRRMVADRDGT